MKGEDAIIASLGRAQDKEALGRIMRALRQEAGLTQQVLATMLGVATSSIQRWEAGESQPGVLEVGKLAKVLEAARRGRPMWPNPG